MQHMDVSGKLWTILIRYNGVATDLLAQFMSKKVSLRTCAVLSTTDCPLIP
jgi:hypothetical protein